MRGRMAWGCVCVCVCVCLYEEMGLPSTCRVMSIYIYVCVCVCVTLCVCVCVCIYTYIVRGWGAKASDLRVFHRELKGNAAGPEGVCVCVCVCGGAAGGRGGGGVHGMWVWVCVCCGCRLVKEQSRVVLEEEGERVCVYVKLARGCLCGAAAAAGGTAPPCDVGCVYALMEG
jgi:hypothetical protein